MQSIEIFLIFNVHAENYGNIRKEFHQKLFLHGQPGILSISKQMTCEKKCREILSMSMFMSIHILYIYLSVYFNPSLEAAQN